MMKNIKYIALLLVMILGQFAYGQTKSSAKNIKRTFYYSFTNVSSDQQIEELKEDILALKSVVKVKSEYKPEKEMGQVVVVVIEPQRTSEDQNFFSIQDLKKVIIKNKLTPHQLQQEEELIIRK